MASDENENQDKQDKYSSHDNISLKLIEMNNHRISSAEAVLQTHPCYDTSLFNDYERGTTSLNKWKSTFLSHLQNEPEQNSKNDEIVARAIELLKKEQRTSGRVSKKLTLAAREFTDLAYYLQPTNEIKKKSRPRRLTITDVSNLTVNDTALLKMLKNGVGVNVNEILRDKIEEQINLDTLDNIKEAFIEADTDGSGSLDIDEFRTIFRDALGISIKHDDAISALFNKIDYSLDGEVSWDEFCTYMQLEFAEKAEIIHRAKAVNFNLPASNYHSPHFRSTIVNVMITLDNNTVLTMSSDGAVAFWSLQGELKKVKHVNQMMKARNKWISSCFLLNEYNKLVVGTGDREIQFWDLSSFEPSCQINSMDSIAISFAYKCNFSNEEVTIFYGDTYGCVNVILVRNVGENLRVWKKLSKIDGIPSVTLETIISSKYRCEYLRWFVHKDLVEMIKYDKLANKIISCSNDTKSSLVIGCIYPSTDLDQKNKLNVKKDRRLKTNENKSLGDVPPATTVPKQRNRHNRYDSISTAPAGSIRTQKLNKIPANELPQNMSINLQIVIPKIRHSRDQLIFSVDKGVKCFDICREKSLLFTGGKDRIIRVWNPYISAKPIAHLKGHDNPIGYLHICVEDERLFSVSSDRLIMVWDMIDHNKLESMSLRNSTTKSTNLLKSDGDMQGCIYCSSNKSIFVCSDRISIVHLQSKTPVRSDIVVSHQERITCCQYNSASNQLVSASDNSTIKLWDIETGSLIFEFTNAHNQKPITALCFDPTGRRLATSSINGRTHLWNFNNGHRLKVLKGRTAKEVTDITFATINKNRFCLTVGWDRHINVFHDDTDDIHHYVEANNLWVDDKKNGHKEDILCSIFAPPNFVGTSCYDGEIIVWNMISGHIFCRITPHRKVKSSEINLDTDYGVNKILFINAYIHNKDLPNLISNGPHGQIHFWTIFNGGQLLSKFNARIDENISIIHMVCNEGFDRMFLADNLGHVYQWNISDHLRERKFHKNDMAKLIVKWRAHTETIVGLEWIEEAEAIVTASIDSTIRIWSHIGEYIGTFGQLQPWNLFDKKTWSHPFVPFDILTFHDESDIREDLRREKFTTFDILQQEENNPINLDDIFSSSDEVEEENKNENIKMENKIIDRRESIKTVKLPKIETNRTNETQDIEEVLKSRTYLQGTGKRLRFEKRGKVVSDNDRLNYYRNLNCVNLEDEPEIPSKPILPLINVRFDEF
ncbi:hypothetical protein SNEBB_007780 [Seison nebaliae]|nr:hypothetical protein SNEBB_007780 [Seison nebaliae]